MRDSCICILMIVTIGSSSVSCQDTDNRDKPAVFRLSSPYTRMTLDFGLWGGASVTAHNMSVYRFGIEYELLEFADVRDSLELGEDLSALVEKVAASANRDALSLGTDLSTSHDIDRRKLEREIDQKRDAAAKEIKELLDTVQLEKLESLTERYALYAIGLQRWVRMNCEARGVYLNEQALNERILELDERNNEWEKNICRDVLKNVYSILTESQIDAFHGYLGGEIEVPLLEEVVADLQRFRPDYIEELSLRNERELSVVSLYGELGSLPVHPILGFSETGVIESELPPDLLACVFAQILVADPKGRLAELCGDAFAAQIREVVIRYRRETQKTREEADQKKRENVEDSRIYEFMEMRAFETRVRFGREFLALFGKFDLEQLHHALEKQAIASRGVICSLATDKVGRNIGLSKDQQSRIAESVARDLERIRVLTIRREREVIGRLRDVLPREIMLDLEKITKSPPNIVYAIPSRLLYRENKRRIKSRR